MGTGVIMISRYLKPKFCTGCKERCFIQNKEGVCEACINEQVPVDFTQYNYPCWIPASGRDLAEITIKEIWYGKLI